MARRFQQLIIEIASVRSICSFGLTPTQAIYVLAACRRATR